MSDRAVELANLLLQRGVLDERDPDQREVYEELMGSPALYSSSSLSGGERAALSILMGMSTMDSMGQAGPGFFIVDEPFSASDTHKIQELGAFLDRTGAQYLVSMPTSLDIARCGVWLQSVLTCTRVAGGVDEQGALRLAPPVRCSYVEQDE